MSTQSIEPARRLTRWLPHGAVALALALGIACLQTATTCDGLSGVRGARPCLGIPTGTPNVDGNIDDLVWDSSARYILDDLNGTGFATASLRALRDSSALYLAFEINNDTQYHLDDVIVLTFDPTGAAPNHRRIFIYPVTETGPATTGAPREVHYWKDSTAAAWSSPTNPAPTWVTTSGGTDNIKVRSSTTGTANNYRVEMKIPIVATDTGNGINLPNVGDFGFYVNVVDAFDSDGSTLWASEMVWPAEQYLGLDVEDTPASSQWGNAAFGLLANSVSPRAPKTQHTPNTTISLTQGNEFSSIVDNHMLDALGNTKQANGVRATFTIRNYGIPGAGAWDPIPVTGNPTARFSIIPPALSRTFSTGSWNIAGTPLEQKYRDSPDQCIRVTIDTNAADTLIVNPTAMSNMRFEDTSSPFTGKARVGIKGYRLPEGARMHEFLLTEYHYHTPREARWETSVEGAQMIPVSETKSGNRRLHHLLRVDPRNEDGVDISMRIEPPRGVKVPQQTVRLRPGARGEDRVSVKPGSLVTVYVNGAIVLRRGGDGRLSQPVRGNGINITALRERRQFDRQPFLLGTEHAPEAQVGAVVASLDGFKQRTFPIGSYATFQVPQGATEIAFGINDTAEGAKLQSGEGYTLEVVQTAADEMYRVTNAMVKAQGGRTLQVLPVGQNLPAWIMCGRRVSGGTLNINGRQHRRLQNVGCFGYLVKSIKGAQ